MCDLVPYWFPGCSIEPKRFLPGHPNLVKELDAEGKSCLTCVLTKSFEDTCMVCLRLLARGSLNLEENTSSLYVPRAYHVCAKNPLRALINLGPAGGV